MWSDNLTIAKHQRPSSNNSPIKTVERKENRPTTLWRTNIYLARMMKRNRILSERTTTLVPLLPIHSRAFSSSAPIPLSQKCMHVWLLHLVSALRLLCARLVFSILQPLPPSLAPHVKVQYPPRLSCYIYTSRSPAFSQHIPSRAEQVLCQETLGFLSRKLQVWPLKQKQRAEREREREREGKRSTS